MDKFIKNTVLTILAFAVIIGGTLASLILPNMLLLNQFDIVHVSISIAVLIITLVLYLLILARVDPESIENPFASA